MESDANLVAFYIASGLVVGVSARLFLSLSFWRWALYGLLIAPVAAIHLIILCVRDSSGDSKPKMGAAILVLIICAAGYVLYQDAIGFQKEDIAATEKSIKEEFEKRPGLKVTKVTLIKETSRKLTGFVNLEVMGTPTTKSCQATMADSGGQYIWRCD